MSENAVKIGVYSAIIAYCLVAIIQHDMKLERSTYEVLQILSFYSQASLISYISSANLKSIMSKIKAGLMDQVYLILFYFINI